MTSTIDIRIAALANMSSAQLRAEWARTFGTATPTLSNRLIALAIAYRLQEKVFDGLPAQHRRQLRQLRAAYEKNCGIVTDAAANVKVGTRLVREWRGVTHQVLICDDGYRYRDRQYRSLSHIAREITGASWSGPRFFGLNAGARRRAG